MTLSAAEPKFLADSMLGKLARWLLLLGYDTSFAGADGRSDLQLLEEARREGRVFLTRDTKIPEVQGLRKIVIREQRFEDQLKRVVTDLNLKPDRKKLFSRCTCCNRALDAVPREDALSLVPPLVRELKTEFFRCPACARLYWNGTHALRTAEKLDRMGL